MVLQIYINNMNKSNFNIPYEVSEKIISFLDDGKTIARAAQVCKDWYIIVQRLINNSNVWERLCKRDINENELTTMINKISYNYEDKIRWAILYKNWFKWRTLKNRKVNVVKYFKNIDMNDLNCAIISDNHLIIGARGCIYIYENNTCKYKKSFDGIVNKISGVIDTNIEVSSGYQHSYFVAQIISKENSNITLCFNDSFEFVSHDILDFFIFLNKYFVKIKSVHVEICQDVFKISNQIISESSNPLCSFRIYSSYDNIVNMFLNHKECTIIDNFGTLYTVDFNKGGFQPACIKDRFHFISKNPSKKSTVLGPDGTVISLNNYFIIIQKGDMSKVSKYAIENLNVTVIVLYGFVLILGCSNGSIYIYYINDFSNIKFTEWDAKINVTNEPIHYIDVAENIDGQVIVATTQNNVFILEF